MTGSSLFATAGLVGALVCLGLMLIANRQAGIGVAGLCALLGGALFASSFFAGQGPFIDLAHIGRAGIGLLFLVPGLAALGYHVTRHRFASTGSARAVFALVFVVLALGLPGLYAANL